jgi:hypothetical protein
MLIVALLLVLLVLGLNVVATVVIVRRDGLSAGGRTVQLLLVWLLPLVGAILCMAVATADGSGSRGMAAQAMTPPLAIPVTTTAITATAAPTAEAATAVGVVTAAAAVVAIDEMFRDAGQVTSW